ncbi:phosphatidylglycerol lysyltransferase domain-containing protein [Rhizobium sp. 18065]|uniref:phosphatidylglycerol lysyltransferase domain-containing protein n=1 Tax=Rhizobium sp. 18065 TaxID=2681411 RepID=UPI0013573865|nr:phosphatidylglycerol lysyltransferase domain-containing protein [Rhizobium sp. 18065]
MAQFAVEAEIPAPAAAIARTNPVIAALLAASLRAVARSRPFSVLLLALVSFAMAVPLFFEESLLQMLWRLWLSRHLTDPAENTLGVTMMIGAIASRGLVRLPRRRTEQPSAEDVARAVELLASQPNASAGLVRLGDKKLLFSDCGQAFIMYARRGRSMVALFDPVGPRALWAPLALKFIGEAKSRRCRPVFYQVSADFLPVTVEARLNALKLGEQAVVDLSRFSLAGGDWLKLRRSINRAERDGLEFQLLAPADVPAIFDELSAVSDAWLSAHKAGEKGFSLGTFKPHYVMSEPVAVIRLEGRIVAFANILTTASGGDAFIDLMRHLPGVHRGMMDLLFVRIMEHLKAEGFRSLNLGMAPFAGLSTHKRAPIWNHVGRQLYENGERFYNFRGVHAFKSKFDPDWQPRYLAVAGAGFPIASLVDVTMLIGGGLKGVLRR